jgi:hypothetical protein
MVLILKDLNRLEESLEFKKRAKRIQDVIGNVGERIAD